MRLMRSSDGTRRGAWLRLWVLCAFAGMVLYAHAQPVANAPVFIPGTQPDDILAYNRGQQLFASNRLTEAYTEFESIATNRQASPIRFSPLGFGWQAEDMMGRIQQRLGNLEESAEHFAQASKTHMALQVTNTSVGDLIGESFLVDRLYHIYELQGKLGLS